LRNKEKSEMRKVLFVFVALALMLAACTPAAAPAAAPAPQPDACPTCAAPAPAAAPSGATGFGDILKAVQARGMLKCGVLTANPGFSVIDTAGNYVGFDIDMCRAVATAVLGDPTKVEFVPTTGETRFTMLQNSDIDVLIRSTTWTFTRDTDLALNFAPPYFYDGQGIMVNQANGFETLQDLDGGSICIGRGGTTELNIADVMEKNGLTYNPVLFDDSNDVIATYDQGRCDAMTNDKSGLNAQRTMTQNPEDHIILDITLSKEPLAPVVRHGDDQWFDIIRWTEFALWAAEEHGITQANVDDMRANSDDPEVRRILGVEDNMGEKLGLSNDWAYNVIKAVGNFAEIYNRHLGPDTPTYIPRGINSLYTEGGLVYPPPFR
jgi:general L-amino acid transport system substrate-binding protein